MERGKVMPKVERKRVMGVWKEVGSSNREGEALGFQG